MEPSAKAGLSAEASAKAGPKDIFMHLLAIAGLYISAASFGALVFQFIDYSFPDPLVDYHPRISDAVRWATASLTIVFPTYLWAAWRIRKDELAEPARRELRIRKWLLYFTLFAASALILGDLVTLLYNFLSGSLSVRFILKVAAVFFIAAVVFGYYLWNLRTEQMAIRDPRMRWFIFGTIGIVVAAIVAGFVVAGSPFAERARRFDERRVQDLQTIQWQVVNFWQRKEKLPAKLDDLRDDISGFVPPRDPESDMSYEYRVSGPLSFELCAAFKAWSQATDVPPQRGPLPAIPAFKGEKPEGSWSHGTGRVCFERIIDPELYPPAPKPEIPLRRI